MNDREDAAGQALGTQRRSPQGGPGTSGRFLAVAALAVATLLGSAYAIGRSLTPDPAEAPAGAQAPIPADQPAPSGARQIPAPGSTGRAAGRSPSPGNTERSPAASRSPSPGNTGRTPGDTLHEHAQDGARQPSASSTADGPYGSQTTSGSADVALTFDDGPDPRYTPQALALLREYRVKATFCVVGENAQNHPDLIQAIVAEGHTLCNHSWDHDVQLGERSSRAIRDDLLRTNAAIKDAVPNARIAYYRQPGGAWTEPVVSVAEELGMIPLHWSVDPNDWQMPGASRIVAAVSAGIEPGAIVLLHDAGGDRQGTIDALYRLLPELDSRFRLAALPIGTT